MLDRHLIPLKKRLRIDKFLSIAVLICSCFLFINCDDSSDKLVYETTAEKHFEVDELIATLGVDASSYKESVITIKGYVQDVNQINQRNTIILSTSNETKSFIICDMQENQTDILKEIKKGQELSIKGVLKGSLTDVILLNCIIYNPETYD